MVCYAVKDKLIKPAEGISGLRPDCVTTLAGFFIEDTMIKTISLTQGQFALVDTEDFVWLNQWRWYARKTSCGIWYASRSDNNGWPVQIQMHRQIMNAQKGQIIDHRDGNGLNNCKTNLRFCTNSQNLQNSHSYNNGKLHYKGIHKTDYNTWKARIRLNGKLINIGTFKYEIEAAQAYDKKAKELFGEFAYPNFPT